MITIPSKILSEVNKKHCKNVKNILISKCEILEICLKFYGLKTKKFKSEFSSEINSHNCNNELKIITINWFLKSSKKKNGKLELQKIKSINNLGNYFIEKNRRFDLKQINLVNELKDEITYLKSQINFILESQPKELYDFSKKYNSKSIPNSNLIKIKNELISFLFDYETFSEKKSIYTPIWGAYELTNSLNVRTCLYCNRNYIQTVSFDKTKVIRPELDHFIPKSLHPILALSFYNLIPSCHTCNSNLKGKKDFNLDEYYHPYLGDYDNQKIRFKYKPKSPTAFFGDRSELNIKLDLSKIKYLEKQIKNNIDLFKINDIYNEHVDIVEGLFEIQRNSNKNRIKDIFNNILIDKNSIPILKSENELYELFIRNYVNEKDFYKKPMAKFERDIAIELGLIKDN